MDSKETTLWAWLIFDAGIKSYQAKQILSLLREREHTLETLFRTPLDELTSMGLSEYTSLLSHPPTPRQYPQAIRWNESLYPQGLHDLTLKQKPALLFYRGSLNLLSRPIITLEPGGITPQAADLLAGIVDILLDEHLLPAVFTESPQEEILLELMSYSEGEALIFVDQGLDLWQPTDEVLKHIQNGRLVAISPMPPKAKSNPALKAIIQRVASAAASRWVISTSHTSSSTYTGLKRPVLQLDTGDVSGIVQLPDSVTASDISDAINWLQNSEVLFVDQTTSVDGTQVVEKLLSQGDTLPPIPSDKALQILEMGGTVPEALRQRLVGNKTDTD